MVNGDRIKTYGFTASELTTNGDGSIAPVYSSYAINGKIKKIIWKYGSFANNGSVGLIVSGTGERLWTFLDCNSNVSDYPMVYGVTSARATGSPDMSTEYVLSPADGIIQVWASGCGSATGGVSATSLNIVYE